MAQDGREARHEHGLAIAFDQRAGVALELRLHTHTGLGNKMETSGSAKDEETELSACFNGSPGWNRTNDQRINNPTLYR